MKKKTLVNITLGVIALGAFTVCLLTKWLIFFLPCLVISCSAVCVMLEINYHFITRY